MRLDHDLLRLLLIDAAEGVQDYELTAYPLEQRNYHRWQLIDGGLAHGAQLQTVGERYPIGVIDGLTLKGHDALDIIRSKEIWTSVQARVFETVGSASFETKVKLAREITDHRMRPDSEYTDLPTTTGDIAIR